MSLIVENGTGLANANGYISEADADAYHVDYGNPAAWSGATTAVKEDAIRLATQYLDAVYGRRWLGYRNLSTQALAWPRTNVTDYDGYVLSSSVLPIKLVQAAAVLALAKVNGDTLLPDVTDPSAIKSTKSKVGPLSSDKEYFGGKAMYKKYSLVDSLIASLIKTNNEMQRS